MAIYFSPKIMPKAKSKPRKNPIELSKAQTLVSEAERYLKNAKQTVKNSPIEDNRFTDVKYVQEAAGIAYLAGLKAINALFAHYRIKLRKEDPQSIEEFQDGINRLSRFGLKKPLENDLEDIYTQLHLMFYYRGYTKVSTWKEALQSVQNLINLAREKLG